MYGQKKKFRVHNQNEGPKLRSRHLHNSGTAYPSLFRLLLILTNGGIFKTECGEACKRLSIRTAFSISYILYFELS